MKVIIKHIDSDIPKDNYGFYNDYMNYLQKQYPLKKDVTIIFRGDRTENMTTGVRNLGYKTQCKSAIGVVQYIIQ